MRRAAITIACAALALGGCQSRYGGSPLYTLNSNVNAVNTLIHSLTSTAGSLTRTRCGSGLYQQPCSQSSQRETW